MWFRKDRIYADAAAATPISAHAKKELIRLLDVYGNAGALHAEGVEAKHELENAREAVAQAIGAHADEIIFTGSGTEGNNLTLQGILRPMLRQGYAGQAPHVITSCIEHSSILEPLRALTRDGLELTELPVDSEGLVSPKELAEAIQENTVLISIQYINSEIGTVEPLREIAKEIRRVRKARRESELQVLEQKSGARFPKETEDPRGLVREDLATQALPIYFHTDASQAPMWLDIKVESLGVDLLTLDAQKVMGPKGVGALYIKRGVEIEPLLLGSKQERGLRGSTENVPLIGSFAVALQDAHEGVRARAERTAEVRNYLWEQIKKQIPDAELNGVMISVTPQQDRAAVQKNLPDRQAGRSDGLAQANTNRAPNNLNISIPGLDREMAVIGLDAEGIAITTRSACNVADSELSYVITALAATSEALAREARAKTAVRITLLPSATKRDARAIAAAIEKIAKRYKSVV